MSIVSIVAVNTFINMLAEWAVEISGAKVLSVHATLPLVGEPDFAGGIDSNLAGDFGCAVAVLVVVDVSSILEGTVEFLVYFRNVSSMVLLDGAAGRCGI